MNKIETGIHGLYVIEPRVFTDERGHFFETHNAKTFKALGIEAGITQINQSQSKKGVLRGLHLQAPPHDQSKLVRCIRGSIFDVAVDVRKGSPTFGKWFGLELSAENKKMLYVPTGFAHGFLSLEDSEMLYLCGNGAYDKASEGGVRWNDASVNIAWPTLDVAMIVNERDATWPDLSEATTPFVFTHHTALACEF